MTNTKTVQCTQCGLDIEVSKFASPKVAKCTDCKRPARKAGPARGTKAWAIQKLEEQLHLYDVIDAVIENGIEQKKLKYGWSMAYGKHELHPYKWYFGHGEHTIKMFGNGRKKTKVDHYLIQVKWAREQLLKVGDMLIEEAVGMTFDQYVVCKYGVWEHNLEAYIEKNDLAVGEDTQDFIQNIMDEWYDLIVKPNDIQ